MSFPSVLGSPPPRPAGRLRAEHLDPVPRESGIARDESETLDDTLRHEHAIERIPVEWWKLLYRPRVVGGDREVVKGLPLDRLAKLRRHDELAKRFLDDDLPDRDRADEDRNVGRRDRVARGRRQLRTVIQPPEEGVRIEEEGHGSSHPKAPAMSGGSSSKSSAM